MGVYKIGVPQDGWFIMENPIKMDDLGVSLFLETSIWMYLDISVSNLWQSNKCNVVTSLHELQGFRGRKEKYHPPPPPQFAKKEYILEKKYM